jgi:hypothetical protein
MSDPQTRNVDAVVIGAGSVLRPDENLRPL